MTVQFYRYPQALVRQMLVEATTRSDRQDRDRSCHKGIEPSSTIQVGLLEDRIAGPQADDLVFDQCQRRLLGSCALGWTGLD